MLLNNAQDSAQNYLAPNVNVPTLRKPGPSPPGLDSTALAGACVEQLLVLPGALPSPHSWRRPSATPSTPAPAQEVGP